MRSVIYVSGNPLVREDSLPIKLMPKLAETFPELEFRELEPTENLPEQETLHIIDTVIGIDKVRIIDDIDKIVTGKVYSLHDFDLGFNLKLMKKTGKLESVAIIGVPPHIDENAALDGIKKAIKSLHKPSSKKISE